MIKRCHECGRPNTTLRPKLCSACYMRIYLANPVNKKRHNAYQLLRYYRKITGNKYGSLKENYNIHMKNKMEKRNEPVKS